MVDEGPRSRTVSHTTVCLLLYAAEEQLHSMDDKGIMNGHADEQQGLHIPEHLLQEAHTTSHVTGTTPRSAGLFDYISRAANSAATILQVRIPCCAWACQDVIK